MTTHKQELVELQNTLYNSKNPTRRTLHCTRRDWIIAAIAQHSRPAMQTAIEIGPGSGVYLPVLRQHFEHVIATDIEDAYLDNARHKTDQLHNLSLIIDDITNSQLEQESVDFILCTEVIEHIKDSQSALNHMWRLLKPSGILLLTTPQRYSPLEQTARLALSPGFIQLTRLVYQEPVLETGHINLMTARVVTHQLQQAGFNIISSDKTGLYIPLIAEFGGQTGLRILQHLENRIKNSMLDSLLWTQYYIAQKP